MCGACEMRIRVPHLVSKRCNYVASFFVSVSILCYASFVNANETTVDATLNTRYETVDNVFLTEINRKAQSYLAINPVVGFGT